MDPSTSGTAEVHGCSNENVKESTGCSRLGSQCDMVDPKLKNNSGFAEAAVYSQNFMARDMSTGSGYIPHEQHQNKNAYDTPISSKWVDDNLRLRFEFYVRSEEGINLVVDLNSSPSDWVEKLNGGVCVHPKSPNDGSQVLPHEIRDLESDDPEANASSLEDVAMDCTNKGDPTFANSVLDSTTVRERNHVTADSPDGSSRSTAVTQANTPVITSGPTEEKNQPHSFCEANFEIHNQPNVLAETPLRTTDEHILASQIKTTGDLAVDSKSVGPKSIDSLEHQSKTVNTNLQHTETGPVGISHLLSGWRLSLESEVLKTLKPFTGIDGKGSGSNHVVSTNGNSISKAESLREDMANSPCQNSGAPDPKSPTHHLQNEIGKFTKCEFDLNKSLDPLTECPEELPRSNPTNDAESSVCSQSDINAENCKRFDNSDPEEPENKRQRVQVDDVDNLAAKRSKNAKKSNIESRPRRSMRLVPK